LAFADFVLYRLAARWPSPSAHMAARLGAEPGTDDYNTAYAQFQFDRKVRNGLGVAVTGLDVLEIGCGHGGISCFMAAAGARSVVGMDLNRVNLAVARRHRQDHAQRLGSASLPVHFIEADARQMSFADGSFDLVIADSLFEHVMDPEAVLREARRVLRHDGRLLVPLFSSIYSKYGLHLKHGLKLPWANLLFSERTIVRAVQRLAADSPRLYDVYPGLRENPTTVRELRKYKDLNDITYAKFRAFADRAGFSLEWFRPQNTRLGVILRRVPGASRTVLMDVCSTGAAALLRRT